MTTAPRLAFLLIGLLAVGCRAALPGTRPLSVAREMPRFVDVTESAGIHFRHENGAFGQKYMPESTGSGCAFFDADGDGRLDLLAINGSDWPGHRRGTHRSA